MPSKKPFPKNSRPHLAEAIERNIKTLAEVRKQMERNKGIQDRIADKITAFSGSMMFAYLHVIWFGIWVPINLGWTSFEPFDPFPFGLLTMIVSLEAIFLSTFVLISQNRSAELADKRADLDLHINLLAEYEITKLLKMVDGIADHLKLKEGTDPELQQLEEEVQPEAMLKAIEQMGK